ncbi:PHD finger protein ALFIN-LIKE 4 isoform X1 [Selaginella moellendorffii]|uniref:PHD finger protein ALFIN-LIKE 4 isoform X1 n=1 Tax=Selaginella moellendorffii TaxID=88036 RepID=UPI000D1C391F|nr:PHD finger protein ALFIN-LIKE 4 isoform X1 [Selaginella moellendorffii]|eukprot:XP_024525358.1 PHD finger protein ALFIN-LIKE 4 isoform X1 [Selaginella moellendorffii]
MENAAPYNPRTVEEIFTDFKNRRAGMVKALTEDVEQFCNECDPDKENLCLYGFPDESWEVNFPAEEVPPELPEPALGINFARDGMERKAWLSLVAVHSDAWLIAVAFFYGAHFDRADRKRLFSLMNSLPTIYDTVTGKKQAQEKTNGNSSSKRASSAKSVRRTWFSACLLMVSLRPQKKPPSSDEEDEDSPYDEDEEEHGDTFCGTCNGPYNADKKEFWIGCDTCQKWFHGSCVKVTPARAEHIKQYKCPSCSKRARV